MAENTEISWTDHTANFWWGCVKVGPQCLHCYAETWDGRYGEGHFGADRPRRFIKSVWTDLPKWDAKARATGKRSRVFVMSMGDFFERLPETHPDREPMDDTRRRAIALMETLTNLEFLILTKRISNVRDMVPAHWLEPGGWPAHVRLGISVGTQKDAERDVPRLLSLPCPNFLSMEPLLERVTLTSLSVGGTYTLNALTGERRGGITRDIVTGPWIDWVVTGGESGASPRPSHPDWFRLLRDECVGAGIPYHLKQWGEWLPNDQDRADGMNSQLHQAGVECFGGKADARHEWEDGNRSHRVGKKAAGRSLDGVLWDQFPESIPIGAEGLVPA